MSLISQNGFSVLIIGDPHFKGDNTLETDQMHTNLIKLALEKKPDFVVVLGDTLHTHEKLYQDSMRRAVHFLRDLRNISKWVYLLIGNHDRPNNNVYLTNEHPFTALEEWERFTVVWKTEIRTHIDGNDNSGTFIFVPYVHVGKFNDALSTLNSKDKEFKLSEVTAIFAHQEYRGAKMGAITSKNGDEWPLNNPIIFSGHVHDFDILQPNIIYTGTPIQHGYADTRDKAVMIAKFDVVDTKLVYTDYTRHSLDIPNKIHIKICSDELLSWVIPPNSHIKLSIEGDPVEIRQLLKLDVLAHLTQLVATHTLVIKIVDKRKQVKVNAPIKANISYQNRLINALYSESGNIKNAFENLFGALPARYNSNVVFL